MKINVENVLIKIILFCFKNVSALILKNMKIMIKSVQIKFAKNWNSS
jgi:hypothetical protein